MRCCRSLSFFILKFLAFELSCYGLAGKRHNVNFLFLFFFLTNLKFDLDGNGFITATEIGNVMKALGEDIPGYKIRTIIDEADKDDNGKVEFNEFMKVRFKLPLSLFFILFWNRK